MLFSQEAYRLLTVLLLVFVVIFLAAARWAVTGPQTILQREDNGRLLEEVAAIQRGDLFDRNEVLIAETVRNDDRTVSRVYPYAAFDGTLGYYSLLYGVDGVEAVYDDLLRGANIREDWMTFLREDLMHIPRQGEDLLLTYDLAVQQALSDLMDDYVGAAVVLSVPEGEVIAMVSQPSYDPNTLDVDWSALIADSDNPLLNRALLGRYQPGSLFYMPLMALAMADRFDMDTVFSDGTMPVMLDDVTPGCVKTPPMTALTLREAYLYGCPAPFLAFAETASIERSLARISGFYQPTASLILEGYTPQIAVVNVPTVSGDVMQAELLGQGSITLTPLSVAAVSAAIINRGNAPQPVVLLASRMQPDEVWQPVMAARAAVPVTTDETASRLRELMLASVEQGAAQAAQRAGLNIGGQVAVAAAGGNRGLVWFTGFVTTQAREGFAIAILLDAGGTPDEAAEIGGIVLEVAVNSLRASRDGS